MFPASFGGRGLTPAISCFFFLLAFPPSVFYAIFILASLSMRFNCVLGCCRSDDHVTFFSPRYVCFFFTNSCHNVEGVTCDSTKTFFMNVYRSEDFLPKRTLLHGAEVQDRPQTHLEGSGDA